MNSKAIYPEFDMRCLEHKEKKIVSSDSALKDISPAEWGEDVLSGNNKITIEKVRKVQGYIKADQFYYFNKSKIDYLVIGSISVELFIELIQLINNLSSIEQIIDNL